MKSGVSEFGGDGDAEFRTSAVLRRKGLRLQLLTLRPFYNPVPIFRRSEVRSSGVGPECRRVSLGLAGIKAKSVSEKGLSRSGLTVITLIFELQYMVANTGVYILRGADETKLRRLYRKHVSEFEVQGIRSSGVTNKERN